MGDSKQAPSTTINFQFTSNLLPWTTKLTTEIITTSTCFFMNFCWGSCLAFLFFSLSFKKPCKSRKTTIKVRPSPEIVHEVNPYQNPWVFSERLSIYIMDFWTPKFLGSRPWKLMAFPGIPNKYLSHGESIEHIEIFQGLLNPYFAEGVWVR